MLNKQQMDYARAILSHSRTCIANSTCLRTVYTHHYTDCSTSFGVTSDVMQNIEEYERGVIHASNGYAFRKRRVSFDIGDITRIYLLAQRDKRYSVYYDTYAIQLVIFDKMFNVHHYPRQLINDYGFTVYQSLFPAYVVSCVAKQYGMVEMWHIHNKLTT